MTLHKPHSKAGQIRQAERTLRALLQTPKTRPGLVAAVVKDGISRNYVFGWISERRRDGTLTVHKSGGHQMYQITSSVISETPCESAYPAWLDPRSIPIAHSRIVVIDGMRVPKTSESNQREKS